MTEQQHADAHRSWKTQVIGQVIGTLLGMGAVGLLGWIALNTSENNATLSRLEQTMQYAVEEQDDQGVAIGQNADDIEKNEARIEDNADKIQRNRRHLDDIIPDGETAK